MEKINGRECNPTNPSTAKVGKHILSGFSMSTISSFKSMENKYDVYRGKYCMKQVCGSVREHAMKIVNFEKKKVIDERVAEII